MSIFVANGTKQLLRYFFRVPGSTRPTMVEIPSGHQMEICKGVGPSELEAVVRHMESFGFRNAQDKTIKAGEVTGIMYRIGKHVTSDAIEAEHAAMVDTQERRSAAEATKAALGFDASTRQGGKRGKRLAKVTEVTVEQDVGARQKPSGDEVHFNLSVTPEGSDNVKLPV
ncbi:MAG: hypothetical protein G3I10_07415 [Ferrovum sp.]|nr:hypothetical protein [Ferrovum sp.]